MNIDEQEWRLTLGIDNNMHVIRWPESQEYMEKDWFIKEAKIINDDIGIELFGDAACIIPIHRLGVNQKINKTIFDVQMHECIQAMEAVVEQTMTKNGDKCSFSQDMCILQAINELDHLINGTELKDFKDK